MSRSGFSLMEMLAMASIIAIVVGIGGASTPNFFSSQRVSAEVLGFIQDVRAGRYGAIGTQAYHRILFKADSTGTVVESYVVQAFVDSSAITSTADINTARNTISNSSWTTVLEVETREIDPEITFEKPSTLSYIFMSPDGLLVDQPNENGAPIGEIIATCTYGESVMNVNINANGIAGTSEYYEDY